MTAPRMVTIRRADGDVTIPEPSWCTGSLHSSGELRVDITHCSRDMELTVPTADGDTPLLSVSLEQRPFTTRPPGTGVFASVELLDGTYPCQPADLDAIAAAMAEGASRIRDLARRLAAEQEGHQS